MSIPQRATSFSCKTFMCASSNRRTYLQQTGKPEKRARTYHAGQLMAYGQMEKRINCRKEPQSNSFYHIWQAEQYSQQIHYTMLLAFAALPKFPTTTSVSQRVYCPPLPYSLYCPCRSAKLLVQIAELDSVLKWTPAASLCPLLHFSNILTVTPSESLRPISWSFKQEPSWEQDRNTQGKAMKKLKQIIRVSKEEWKSGVLQTVVRR